MTATASDRDTRIELALVAVFAVVFVWSGIRPHDYFTWFLETVPAILALVILAATHRRFPLTSVVYVFICLHAIVLCIGGHYTYARVPLGDWFSAWLHLSRNYYDRVGHFMQGFVPALIAREVLVRLRVVRGKAWLFFIVTSICLAISASYEFFEYAVAVATGSQAEDFLGTQGDPWDTQNDMLLATIGALAAQLLLYKVHDRAILNLKRR